MGLFDLLRREPEKKEDLYKTPLPVLTPAGAVDIDKVRYFTENPALSDEQIADEWEYNVQHMSFVKITAEEKERLLEDFDQERRIKRSFRLKFDIFRDDIERDEKQRRYKKVVDLTLGKAVDAGFQKSLTEAHNVFESKIETGEIKETKERGGVMGFLGI